MAFRHQPAISPRGDFHEEDRRSDCHAACRIHHRVCPDPCLARRAGIAARKHGGGPGRHALYRLAEGRAHLSRPRRPGDRRTVHRHAPVGLRAGRPGRWRVQHAVGLRDGQHGPLHPDAEGQGHPARLRFEERRAQDQRAAARRNQHLQRFRRGARQGAVCRRHLQRQGAAPAPRREHVRAGQP